MSGKISGIVWEADLPQNEKYVLLAYADHADHEGLGVFPSVGLIAWKTGYSERNIPRIKNKLIKKKILQNTGFTSVGVPIYRIVVTNIPKLPPRKQVNDDKLSVDDNLSGGDTIVSGGGDTIVSPKPSVNRQFKKDKKDADSEFAPVDKHFGEVSTLLLKSGLMLNQFTADDVKELYAECNPPQSETTVQWFEYALKKASENQSLKLNYVTSIVRGIIASGGLAIHQLSRQNGRNANAQKEPAKQKQIKKWLDPQNPNNWEALKIGPYRVAE